MTTQFAKRVPENRRWLAQPRVDEHTPGIVEALLAAATVVLSILQLAGVGARFLDSVACIALGAAFLFERWTFAAPDEEAGTLPEHEGGLIAESAAGWTAVVLGVLSLLRVAPNVLNPIAVIGLGAGLALGGDIGARVGRVPVGVAAIVLGIVALTQVAPRTLTLVSLLALGGALLLTGPLVAWRMHRTRPAAALPAARPRSPEAEAFWP